MDDRTPVDLVKRREEAEARLGAQGQGRGQPQQGAPRMSPEDEARYLKIRIVSAEQRIAALISEVDHWKSLAELHAQREAQAKADLEGFKADVKKAEAERRDGGKGGEAA